MQSTAMLGGNGVDNFPAFARCEKIREFGGGEEGPVALEVVSGGIPTRPCRSCGLGSRRRNRLSMTVVHALVPV